LINDEHVAAADREYDYAVARGINTTALTPLNATPPRV